MIQKNITTKFLMQHKILQNVSCKATQDFVTIYATMSKTEKLSDEIQKEFGQWLKLQRKAADLTQGVVSTHAPIDRVHLARIESGESGTKRDTVVSLVETINNKSKTNHKIDLNEAVDRFYGRWEPKNIEPQKTEVQIIAERLAGGVMASGFDDLEDEDLQQAFLEDMQTIAESMLRRRLQEQEKRRKAGK